MEVSEQVKEALLKELKRRLKKKIGPENILDQYSLELSILPIEEEALEDVSFWSVHQKVIELTLTRNSFEKLFEYKEKNRVKSQTRIYRKIANKFCENVVKPLGLAPAI